MVYGKHWALGHEAVPAEGLDFQIPAWARAVTAYVDADGDHTFDRFAEPSAACARDVSGWACIIPRQRMTVFRELSARGGARRDGVYVFWEEYQPDGRSSAQAELCLGDLCTRPELSPFLAETAAQANWVSICDPGGLAASGAVARTASGAVIPVALPAAIDASVALRRRGGGLTLQIDAAGADRALVWGGVSTVTGEVQQVYWHSEDGEVSMERSKGGFEVEVPAHAVKRCGRDPRCVLVVQILKYWRSPDERAVGVTERREAVDLREAL